MAGKKRINQRTGKTILAKTVALSMCVSLFQPGGGTKVLVYAAEETEDTVLHKWDFEDNTIQNWKVSGWASITAEEKLGIANTDGKIGFNFKGDTSEDGVSAGIEQETFSGIDSSNADKISVDFYYDANCIKQGSLAVRAYAQDNKTWTGDIVIDGKNTIDITNNPDIVIKDAGNGLKMTTLSFELDKTKLSEAQIGKIGVMAVGNKTDYDGKVYFDNITISKTADKTSGGTSLKELYDFEDGLQGWKKDGWLSEGIKAGEVTHDTEGKRLKMPLDYTSVSDKDWQDATVCLEDSNGLDFSAYNNMAFDFYYKPESMTKGNIALKAAASVDEEDLFSEQKLVDYDDAAVSDSGDGFKKVTFTFKIDEEKAKNLRPGKIDIVITGRETDYNGDIYIDNIRFSKTETAKIKELYDFNDGLQGWEKSGWINAGVKAGEVTHDVPGQRLKMGIDFSGVAGQSWVGAGISLTDKNGLDFSDYNTMSFEFYYDPSKFTEGNIALKASAVSGSDNLFGDQASSINDIIPENAEGGLKKAVFTLKIDEEKARKIKPEKIDIIVNGIETAYNGDIYFDNIKFSWVSDDDKYVNSTIPVQTKTNVTGTDTALSVNGTSHNYADSVKLADDQADAQTVALYQYLKAVGESSSVIYGHMEDTVLKAGASGLTYSDTEDVTGSISAIDGLDCGGLFSGFAEKFISRYPDKAKELGIVNDDNTAEDDIKAAAAFSNISIGNGAIITLSSHMPNFAYAERKENADSINKTYDKFNYLKSSYELTGDCMNNILPGGKFTVTIPPSELEKMQGGIDISIKAGNVSQTGGSKQKNIESILSANGIKAENAAIVSIASNNTKGGIKASAPVINQSIKPGDKVYVYCYNNKTGKLEEIANSARTVLKNGMTGIEGYSGNDYVVTDKELNGKNVVTLLGQSKVKFNKTSVKKGGKVKINIALPTGLKTETSLKKKVPYAKQAAVVTYKSSDNKIVKVSKNGTVKAAGRGKATITVKIKLADGKVKTVKKKVTVK